MTRRGAIGWALGLGIPVVAIIVLVSVWQWDWFIPFVQARASASLGRPVTISHLHVRLGRIVQVTADDVVVANPPNWEGEPLARIPTLATEVDAWAYIRHGAIVVPSVSLDQPRVHLEQNAGGDTNYALKLASSGSSSNVRIGDLRINDGEVRAQLVKLKSDLTVAVATEGSGDEARIRATPRGTYGGAPIKGQFVGGALLSLRDSTKPWPVDLKLENGPTQVSLAGTLQDPLHLAGANLRLAFAGPDMGQLEKLTGIPIPKTPPYRVTGQLDFAGMERIKFRDFQGSLGKSDIGGSIEVNPGKDRPEVTADLRSRQIDLVDLGGFIGATPKSGNQPEARQSTNRQDAEKQKLLPDTPISVPRLQWADVHLRYRGQHIIGESIPLDDFTAVLDIDNGTVNLHPLSFGVGTGRVKGNVLLTPREKQVQVKADIELQQVDVSRLMAATHTFHGTGTISGTGRLKGTGRSLATILANADGDFRLGMAGGDLSALLIDLSGLQFGNALLSALGLPDRTPVECLAANLPVQHGVMSLQPLVLDTGEAIINGGGAIDLGNEKLDLSLRTEAKHFTIGSLPAPINVTGTFKQPSVRPGAELAARGGLAAGLAAVFPPLALLPMIQFGTGEDHRCDRILQQMKRQPGGDRIPSARR